MGFRKRDGEANHHAAHDRDAIWLRDIFVDGLLDFGEGDDVEFDVALVDVKLRKYIGNLIDDG